MNFDPINALRYAQDTGYAAAAILSNSPYKIYLIAIQPSGRTRTDTRLTVSDGYRNYAPSDGYLNPMCYHITQKEVILSGKQLTPKDYKFSLVLPYSVGNLSGGLSTNIFDPGTAHEVIYIKIVGNDTPSTGIYCKIDHIEVDDDNISYDVYCKNTGAKLPI